MGLQALTVFINRANALNLFPGGNVMNNFTFSVLPNRNISGFRQLALKSNYKKNLIES